MLRHVSVFPVLLISCHVLKHCLFGFFTAGMVWSVRRWSLPAISSSLPSVNRHGIACSSRTCCCSAAPGPISPSRASVPAETTWKDRWRCARTAYNTHTSATWRFICRRTGQDRTVTQRNADRASVVTCGDAIKEFRVIQLLFYSHKLTKKRNEKAGVRQLSALGRKKNTEGWKEKKFCWIFLFLRELELVSGWHTWSGLQGIRTAHCPLLVWRKHCSDIYYHRSSFYCFCFSSSNFSSLSEGDFYHWTKSDDWLWKASLTILKTRTYRVRVYLCVWERLLLGKQTLWRNFPAFTLKLDFPRTGSVKWRVHM